ncbi:MAG TPA: discoidin domain-containing protein [Thermoanaerobaculia bacterium]|nr:discoidin domain-containing protein [Thermoanaerobaculia bacterium]
MAAGRVAVSLAAIAAAGFLSSCSRIAERRTSQPALDSAKQTSTPPKKLRPLIAEPPDDHDERGNLLNIALGATIVSRSGEASLDSSALMAVDGDPISGWTSPPGDLEQSLVVALPTRSRIDRIGVLNVTKAPGAGSLAFESSIDGVEFRPLGTIVAKQVEDLQLIAVPPTDSAFLRVTMKPGASSPRAISILSAQARGRELEVPRPGRLDGCWSVNEAKARFAQRGAHVRGIIEGEAPTFLDGGSDGRFFRLAWMRGPQYGMAGLSVSPDGKHLSGIVWYEEAIPLFFGTCWLGEQRACVNVLALPEEQVFRAFLDRVHRFPLYGLRFDSNGSLIAEESQDMLALLESFLRRNPAVPLRLAAHEFHEADAERNRARAQRELDSLKSELQRLQVELTHVTFVAIGSDHPRQQPLTEAQRGLYSSIDLELPPAPGSTMQ